MPRWNRFSSTLGYAYISVLGLASAACSLGDFDSLGDGPDLNVGGGGSGSTAGDGGTGGRAGNGGSGGSSGVGGTGGTSGDGGTGSTGGSAGVGGSSGEVVNLITNPGFEEGSVSWSALGSCINDIVEDDPYEGDHCLKTRNRLADWNGPAYTLTRKATPNATYLFSVWVRADASDIPDGGAVPLRLTYKRKCPSLGDMGDGYFQPFASSQLTAEWAPVQGEFSFPDCPDLAEYSVYVEGPPVGVDIYLDETSITLIQ
jgi:hypothetical protein